MPKPVDDLREKLTMLFMSKPDLEISNQWLPIIEQFIQTQVKEASKRLEVPESLVKHIISDYREDLANRLGRERQAFVDEYDEPILDMPDVVRARRAAFMQIERQIREDTWSKPYVSIKPSPITVEQLSEQEKV